MGFSIFKSDEEKRLEEEIDKVCINNIFFLRRLRESLFYSTFSGPYKNILKYEILNNTLNISDIEKRLNELLNLDIKALKMLKNKNINTFNFHTQEDLNKYLGKEYIDKFNKKIEKKYKDLGKSSSVESLKNYELNLKLTELCGGFYENENFKKRLEKHENPFSLQNLEYKNVLTNEYLNYGLKLDDFDKRLDELMDLDVVTLDKVLSLDEDTSKICSQEDMFKYFKGHYDYRFLNKRQKELIFKIEKIFYKNRDDEGNIIPPEDLALNELCGELNESDEFLEILKKHNPISTANIYYKHILKKEYLESNLKIKDFRKRLDELMNLDVVTLDKLISIKADTSKFHSQKDVFHYFKGEYCYKYLNIKQRNLVKTLNQNINEGVKEILHVYDEEYFRSDEFTNKLLKDNLTWRDGIHIKTLLANKLLKDNIKKEDVEKEFNKIYESIVKQKEDIDSEINFELGAKFAAFTKEEQDELNAEIRSKIFNGEPYSIPEEVDKLIELNKKELKEEIREIKEKRDAEDSQRRKDLKILRDRINNNGVNIEDMLKVKKVAYVEVLKKVKSNSALLSTLFFAITHIFIYEEKEEIKWIGGKLEIAEDFIKLGVVNKIIRADDIEDLFITENKNKIYYYIKTKKEEEYYFRTYEKKILFDFKRSHIEINN